MMKELSTQVSSLCDLHTDGKEAKNYHLKSKDETLLQLSQQKKIDYADIFQESA